MGDGSELEVVVCVQGIIADMDLPPISRYVSLNYTLHFLQVMLLSFARDLAASHFAMFCDRIFELLLLTQFLMDSPKT